MIPSSVDTHAHVFTCALPLMPGRRYTPTRDATLGDYFAELDRHGVGAGVLVQPSFLGTDNSHMLAALEHARERLRGIAVVDPDVSDRTLDQMGRSGVVGIRFNLIGDDPKKLARPEWRALARRAADRGWQIELHANGGDLPDLLDLFEPVGTHLVVDHFGRPDPARGCDDEGFRRLLAAGPGGNIWVKLSGAYRLGGADAALYARTLIDALGPGRLVWGSDWPFTQFEATRRYADGVAEFTRWCDEKTQAAIAATSRTLFGFGVSPR